jgi:hypothetical protein
MTRGAGKRRHEEALGSYGEVDRWRRAPGDPGSWSHNLEGSMAPNAPIPEASATVGVAPGALVTAIAWGGAEPGEPGNSRATVPGTGGAGQTDRAAPGRRGRAVIGARAGARRGGNR